MDKSASATLREAAARLRKAAALAERESRPVTRPISLQKLAAFVRFFGRRP